jgi:hypothetical protein
MRPSERSSTSSAHLAAACPQGNASDNTVETENSWVSSATVDVALKAKHVALSNSHVLIRIAVSVVIFGCTILAESNSKALFYWRMLESSLRPAVNSRCLRKLLVDRHGLNIEQTAG